MWFTALALAAPPVVVEVDPPAGVVGIDASTVSEVVVVFDQPMDPRGRSVAHRPGRGPRDAGDLYWRDDHTFVYPVRLRPDRAYEVWFNYGFDHGFQSLTGEVATPFRWSMYTGPGPDARVTDRANERVVRRLREALDRDYAHRDLYGIDWDTRWSAYGPQLLEARSPGELGRAAGEMLSAVPDAHLSLRGHGWWWTHHLGPEPNVDRERLRTSVPEWHQEGRVATGRFADGITYLGISSWDAGTRSQLDRIHQALVDADPEAGLVVDVRDNRGGDERWALDVAGCFVDAPVDYASVRVLRHGVWHGPYVNQVTPNRTCGGIPASRVVVLQGPASASTTESFLKMMHLAGARSVGEPSAGTSGRPVRHPLGQGLVLGLPSWIETWPDGTPNEGMGIVPDHVVPPREGADAVLEAALNSLRDR